MMPKIVIGKESIWFFSGLNLNLWQFSATLFILSIPSTTESLSPCRLVVCPASSNITDLLPGITNVTIVVSEDDPDSKKEELDKWCRDNFIYDVKALPGIFYCMHLVKDGRMRRRKIADAAAGMFAFVRTTIRQI